MIPSTYLGLSSVCLSSGVLVALVPGQGCLCSWSVLVIRLQRLHLLLTVALLGLFSYPLRKLLMQKDTHTREIGLRLSSLL